MDNYVTLRKFPKLLAYSALLSGSILGYFHIIREHFFEIGMCQGNSMTPALHTKCLVLLKKMNLYNLKKGDIVVFRSPYDPEKFVCKRVIHLAHEFVESHVYSGKIPSGHVWLEGDNSVISIDSRHHGPVPKGLLVGKVVFTVWPLGINLNLK